MVTETFCPPQFGGSKPIDICSNELSFTSIRCSSFLIRRKNMIQKKQFKDGRFFLHSWAFIHSWFKEVSHVRFSLTKNLHWQRPHSNINLICRWSKRKQYWRYLGEKCIFSTQFERNYIIGTSYCNVDDVYVDVDDLGMNLIAFGGGLNVTAIVNRQ